MAERRSRPSTVLMLVDHLVAGGAERVATQLAKGITQSHRVVICASREPPTSLDDGIAASAGGVEVLRLGRTGRLAIHQWIPLYRFLRRERVDVLHAHKFGSNIWGAIIGRLARVPVVIAHEHWGQERQRRVQRWLNRHLVGRLADAVIVASDHSGQALEREGVPKSKIVVVRNGLPDKTDRPSSDAPNGVVGKPRLGADLIVVAMLRPEKGLDVAIDALPHVLAERADARLSIAGGVDNQQAADVVAALRERVARLGIQDRVDFLGRRSDVDRLLSEADVALLSSHVESMPMAMLEYMEAGVPIVATNVGGVPEMVRDGIEALLVPPNDPEALARGILEVLADPSEAATRAAAAQRRRSETFSLTQAAAEVTALYSRCDGASGN